MARFTFGLSAIDPAGSSAQQEPATQRFSLDRPVVAGHHQIAPSVFGSIQRLAARWPDPLGAAVRTLSAALSTLANSADCLACASLTALVTAASHGQSPEPARRAVRSGPHPRTAGPRESVHENRGGQQRRRSEAHGRTRAPDGLPPARLKDSSETNAMRCGISSSASDSQRRARQIQPLQLFAATLAAAHVIFHGAALLPRHFTHDICFQIHR